VELIEYQNIFEGEILGKARTGIFITRAHNFELWNSVEKEFSKITIIEENGFLTDKSDK
jgi:hypothetical protein